MRTPTIGRETPILTYQIFRALAERNEREARRKEKAKRLKAALRFWRKEVQP